MSEQEQQAHLTACGASEAASQAAKSERQTRAEMLALRTKFDEQSAELTRLIGHQNHKQKIQLHAQIKEENNVLKREVATLKAELKRLKSTQLALESNVTTPVVGSSHKCPPMSRTRFPSNLNPQHLVPVSPAVGPPRSGAGTGLLGGALSTPARKHWPALTHQPPAGHQTLTTFRPPISSPSLRRHAKGEQHRLVFDLASELDSDQATLH